MREGFSLRTRLNMMIISVIVIIIGIGFFLAVHNARRSVENEVGSTVNLALQLIEAGLAETRDTGKPLSEWLLQLRRLEHTRHLSIRVYGLDAVPIDLVGSGPDEGRQVPGWFVWLVGPQPAALEQRLPDGRGGQVRILIEANAADEIAEAWQETQGFLLLLVALAVSIYALVHVMVGRALGSVATILEGLERIEKGDYGQRLPAFELPEFARISHAFNHMASALDKSQADNHALIQRSMAIQEEERRHLSRELHDELGQSLTAIKVMASALRLGGEQNREEAEHILGLCDRLFAVFRGMMRRLRPGLLDDLGLGAALEELVGSWRDSHPSLSIELHCDASVDGLGSDTRIQLFRIIQESLTNVVRHAQASRVLITLWSEAGSTRLRFQDDGRGFDPRKLETPKSGLGLMGIRERVAALGGEFQLTTRPGEGVALEINLPQSGPNS